MQTAITKEALKHPEVKLSESILRSCVHCGFCNATCPTYQVFGNELEGPRGRIYLMKSVLEDRIPLNRQIVEHLDNCLACLSCETTCPSGVRYSHLMDPMRERIEADYSRPLLEKLQRFSLTLILPNPARFRLALNLARLAKPLAWLLPRPLKNMVRMAPMMLPARSRLDNYSLHAAQGARRARVALLAGCAQRVVGPYINDATIRYLTRIGCEVVLPPNAGCCGALVYHMGNHKDSLPMMKTNINAWHAEMETGGLDYIVINTSGCGSVVKDYGHIFRNDPEYAHKAAAVSNIVRDFSEVADELGIPQGVTIKAPEGLNVAYHDACSLQHAQKIRHQPRNLLTMAGYRVQEIPQGHLCCGSAGTYNLLKPQTATQLGKDKVRNIARLKPDVVSMGNLGCMEQIAGFTKIPVAHTAELLDWATGGRPPHSMRGFFWKKK